MLRTDFLTSKRFVFIISSLLLFGITALCYWSSLSYEFVYDDFGYVVANFKLNKGLTFENLRWAFSSFEQANWHPLTWVALLLQFPFFGFNPTGYHLVNIILHAANVILLLGTLQKLTGLMGRSFLVAVLFCVHPTHIESVVWISELKDVLSCFFWMISLLFYISYARRPAFSTYMGTLVSLALGLMAKPMLVTLPFVFLLLDAWPLGRFASGVDSACRKRTYWQTGLAFWTTIFPLLLEKTPFFILCAASSFMTFLAQRSGGAVATLERLPFLERILNALIAYTQYLYHIVWPAKLAFHYPHPGAWPLWQVAGCAAFLALTSWSCIRLRKTAPYLLFGWLWYLGTLIPVIGLVQVGTQAMADRYLYIPSIGVFIALVWSFSDLAQRLGHGRLLLRTLGYAAVFTLMMAHVSYLKYWKSELTLYSRGLEIAGPSFTALHNLGFCYFKQGERDKALHYLQESLKFSPTSSLAHNNIGLVYAFKNEDDKAEEHFKTAISLNQTNANAYTNLANIEIRRGGYDNALALLEKSIALDPQSPGAYETLGQAYLDLKQYDRAYQSLAHSLTIFPNGVIALYKMGLLFLSIKDYEKALEYFNQALKLDDSFYEAFNSSGVIYIKMKRYDAAEEAFKKALHIQKDFKPATDNLKSLAALRTKDQGMRWDGSTEPPQRFRH